MPCYTRETSSVEFGDKTDPKMLAKALEDLGFSVTINADKSLRIYGRGYVGQFQAGNLTVSGRQSITVEETNEIKRAYSKQIVLSAAQRFGWAAKQTDEQKFQITRRI